VCTLPFLLDKNIAYVIIYMLFKNKRQKRKGEKMRKRKIFLIILIGLVFLSFCSCNKQEKDETILKKIRMDGFFSMLEKSENGEERNLIFALKVWQIIVDSESRVKKNIKEESNRLKVLKSIIASEITTLAARIKNGSINDAETTIYRKDMVKAIEILYEAFCIVADNEGDSNGIFTEEEQKVFARKHFEAYYVFKGIIEIY